MNTTLKMTSLKEYFRLFQTPSLSSWPLGGGPARQAALKITSFEEYFRFLADGMLARKALRLYGKLKETESKLNASDPLTHMI